MPLSSALKPLLALTLLLHLSACHHEKTTSPLSCADTLFLCETFESNIEPPKPWQASNTHNVNISSEIVYSGNHALKVIASGEGYNANYLSLELADTPLQNQLYGRMMMWLSDENTNGGDFTFIQASGMAKPSSGAPPNTPVVYRGRLDGRHDHFMANYDTWIDADNNGQTDWLTDCWKHPNGDGGIEPPPEYRIPKNQWACVQWHFDANKNEMQFWLNGQELSDLHVQQSGDGCLGDVQKGLWLGPEKFQTLKIGIEQYHSWAKSRTLYIDDITLDDSMVACE